MWKDKRSNTVLRWMSWPIYHSCIDFNEQTNTQVRYPSHWKHPWCIGVGPDQNDTTSRHNTKMIYLPIWSGTVADINPLLVQYTFQPACPVAHSNFTSITKAIPSFLQLEMNPPTWGGHDCKNQDRHDLRQGTMGRGRWLSKHMINIKCSHQTLTYFC